MASEEEKKQKKREWGNTLGNIARFVKYLSNPIIFWIAIGLLILLLLIGVVGFFTSLPSNSLGWITNLVLGVNPELKVTDGEIKDLCNYIEEMGYDLEGYGFVEEIKRSGEKTYNDQTFAGNIPDKGTIDSVKSKYLEAYLIAEKKSYVIANPEFQTDRQLVGNIINFKETCRYWAIEDAFNDVWDNSYFNKAISEFYEYDGEYYIKKIAKLVDDGSVEYASYAKIKKNELRDIIKKMVVAYYNNNQKGAIDNLINITFGALGNDTKWAYLFGEELLNLDSDSKNALQEAIDNYTQKYMQEQQAYEYSSTGMIFLENNEAPYSSPTSADWLKNETEYKVRIDKENRRVIVQTPLDTFWNKFLALLGFEDISNYAYDLDGWITKYGKPTEFLISMHLATQAPDFVYQLATSPQVDTKVHIDVFPVEMNLCFVTEDGGDVTLESILEEADKNPENINKYKALIDTEITEYLEEALQIKILGVNVGLAPGATEEIEKLINNLRGAQSITEFFDILKSKIIGYANANQELNKIGSLEYIKMNLNGQETVYTFDELLNKDKESIYTAIEKYQGQIETATPYITKVVNHWYRNQYFLEIDEDISSKKQRLRIMINRVYSHFTGRQEGSGNAQNGIQDTDTLKTYSINRINSLSTIEEINNFIDEQKTAWLERAKGAGKDESTIEKITNEFTAVDEQFKSKVDGSAYQVIANSEPRWYELPEGAELSDNENVNSFLRQLYVKETRTADITQIHNPMFEDNSQYIRNWLKEKYYIYDGTKKEESDRMAEGKDYIQGKTALQAVETMLSECKDREDLHYMLRDVKELFQDFEFDLENVEVPAQKVLSNIMPDYKPYTAWPSIYEKTEINCTKMIYKTTGQAKIVAPANGRITRSGSNYIEIELTGEDEQTSSTEGMVLYIEAEQGSLNLQANKEVTRQTQIATANSSDGMIILKLRLISPTKQLLKVENYMNVEKISYDTENKDYCLSDEEKILLYNLQKAEIDVVEEGILWNRGESQITSSQRMALVSTVFNKISSPYYPEYSSVSAVLSSAGVCKDADYLRFAKDYQKDGTLSDLEKTENAKYAIIVALGGADLTKTNTLLGATRYFGDEDYYNDEKLGLNSNEKDEFNKAREDLKTKLNIGNRTFGIAKEEYEEFVGEMLEKKIDEVIYTLNREKYVHGLEELYEKFEPVKESIKAYYYSGAFIQECSTVPQPEGASTITEVVKSNVSQEEKENGEQDNLEETEAEGNKTVIDKFTLTVNSNYSVKWKCTYEIGPEGKIISSIKLEKDPIVNF